jgi:DNA-binding NarL/FixJ family response regulator
MNTRHRLVLADDHCVIRDLLKLQLERCANLRYEIVGEAATGQEAVDSCLLLRPDLLLLDLMLPGLNGVEVVKRLQTKVPRLRVLMFSASTCASLIAEAFTVGVAGFVCKPRPWSTVLAAIDLVADGGKYYDPAVAHLAGRPAHRPEFQDLTAREREVAQSIGEGRSTKEIAALLSVSAKTIDKHRTRLMEKLHVHDAVSVARYAIQAGLVSLD